MTSHLGESHHDATAGNEMAPVAQQESGRALQESIADPFADPGLEEHEPRPTDVDEKAGRRAERQISMFFIGSALCALLFCVSYFVFNVGSEPTVIAGYGASNVSLGLFLGLALLFIGVGAIQWARKLMSDVEVVEMRHPTASSEEDRAETLKALESGVADSGIARRPLMRNSLLGAMAMLGLPAVLTLRDLGPLPGDKLSHTVWAKGMRVVNDVAGTPIRPEEVEIGQLINAQPEIIFEKEPNGEPKYEGTRLLQEKTKCSTIVVRMKPEDITPSKQAANWGVGGILCYSKICTHVGCPISLWEQQTHHLLCPCHQSTFDLADNGKVIFGPAGRSLPQLPLMVDGDGYLVAQSDFLEPVGPSFWERGDR
jgi:ubiquinol-cytochrome c reductase iron-sulfur subunit